MNDLEKNNNGYDVVSMELLLFLAFTALKLKVLFLNYVLPRNLCLLIGCCLATKSVFGLNKVYTETEQLSLNYLI